MIVELYIKQQSNGFEQLNHIIILNLVAETYD